MAAFPWGTPMLLRFGRVLLVVVYAALVASLLLFSLFEIFPSLLDAINLQAIAYYALKRELLADPALVFVPRKVNTVLQTTWKGDQYSSEYGVDVVPMPFVATTNAEGFRPNKGSGQIRAKIYAKALLIILQRDGSKIR
jgi:hypothetical protein